MKMLTISDEAVTHTITVQPGDVVMDCQLLVSALLTSCETVASAQADNEDAVTAATAKGRTVLIDITGPANGVQVPVTITVRGSLGSVRRVALIIAGKDPFADIPATNPDIFLKWRGNYDAGIDYAPFDLVLYGGTIYLALKRSIGVTPDIHMESWLAWAASGGGGGAGGLIPDRGGSGRYAAFDLTWEGPGKDDWAVKVVGVEV